MTGDRLKVPGIGNSNMIMVFKAKDIKTMYSSDGRIPLLPGFDNFEYARAVTLKHRFPTCGLISNKVTMKMSTVLIDTMILIQEDWYSVRSLVQQDMMRPKSALYYTKEMEEISQEVADIIERDMDSDNCYEINSICQKYALETVAYIFLGSKLGTLAGEGDGTRMVEIQVILTSDWTGLVTSF